MVRPWQLTSEHRSRSSSSCGRQGGVDERFRATSPHLLHLAELGFQTSVDPGKHLGGAPCLSAQSSRSRGIQDEALFRWCDTGSSTPSIVPDQAAHAGVSLDSYLDCGDHSMTAGNSANDRETSINPRKKISPFCCSLCPYSTHREDHVIRHMRTHTGERPFSCSVCSRAFSVKSTLVAHMRTHTGEKPFKCYVCAAAFRFRSGLDRHMPRHSNRNP